MDGLCGRILVADNHPLCRAGLVNLFKEELGFAKFDEASDFAHLLAAIARHRDVTLTTVDLGLPGLKGGTGLRRLRTDHPSICLVVVAETRDRELVLDALCAGVHGYVLKDLPADEMNTAFRTIMQGQIYVPPLLSDLSPVRSTAASVGPAQSADLTDRQFEVLQLVAAGRSNKEIARSLQIAEGTVKVHITAAFRALGVHNRVSAAAALQNRPRNDNRTQASIPGLFGDLRGSPRSICSPPIELPLPEVLAG